MTLCVGWIRSVGDVEEVCLAADSCFSGGQRFHAAPKIFPLNRGDCALACSGDTTYSFPVVEHITRAIEINQKLRDRACDVTAIKHTIVDIANRCLFEEKENQSGEPNFQMIVAGYSWRLHRPFLEIVKYDKNAKLMRSETAPTIKGKPVAVIGDSERIMPARKRLFDMLEKDGIQQGGDLDMQPLNLLLEHINNPAIDTINGYPQMVKIYPFMKVLPIGFLIQEKGKSIISYYGRPLLKYETFPYPIYNLSSRKFVYMKKTVEEFQLEHEELKSLTMFRI